ncbi:MAG TPA: hypothetical protein VMI53_13680 [Opitutaceae bacterium]|nr:hypothetical protein [Opitutaceae bacterium]
MKTFKLITAGTIALLACSAASAFTEITITGSTAFRNAVVDSCKKILQNSASGTAAGTNGDYVWGSVGNNQQLFVGTTLATLGGGAASQQVVIKLSWSGSAGGVQSVAQQIAPGQAFIIDPNAGINFTPGHGNPVVASIGAGLNLQNLTNAGIAVLAANQTDLTTKCDCAMSDAYIESTPYSTGVAPNFPITSQAVGIVPFVWVGGGYTTDGGTTLNSGLYPGVSNLTIDQAQELLSGGLQLSQITGNPADAATGVFCVGRDHDSGTRIAAEYDSQLNGDIYFGATTGYSTVVLQYIPNGGTINGDGAPWPHTPYHQFDAQSAGAANLVISELDPWPLENVLGELRGAPLTAPGDEGWFSGGVVANTLKRPGDINGLVSGNPVYVISYLGLSDSFSVNGAAVGYNYVDGAGQTDVIKPSQNALLWQGVFPGTAAHPFGPPYANIENGEYSFWGVEHFVHLKSLAGVKLSLANAVAKQITTEADFGGTGDLLNNMQVFRGGDGAPIVPGNAASYTE